MTPTSFRRQVARRIRKARWRLGLTQEDAAVAAKLSARYFAEVERGHRNPTLDTLHAVARALKVTVADLVDVEPDRRIDLDAIEVEPVPAGRKPKRVRR
ncbi:MAG: helix-turn-helix domain-containing protein [Myxococcales bacterium]|nr:helix-turn-helix domain-containing protein [Myxococcales bacterium]